MKVAEGTPLFNGIELEFWDGYVILTSYGWTFALYHILFLGELMG